MKTIKKLITLVLILAIIASTGVLALASEIGVNINGTSVSFDQPPIVKDGRLLLPLRAIFEAIGAKVDWDTPTQTVTATKDDVVVILQIGSYVFYRNGSQIALDTPAQIVDGRTLVPLQVINESFDVEVDLVFSAHLPTVGLATASAGEFSSDFLDIATYLLANMTDVFNEDNGALWGTHLNAPFMIADAATREIITNMPDNYGNLVRQGDVYVGVLPDGIFIGNTIMQINNQIWGMMTRQLVEGHIDDTEFIVRTMIHELFHAWQPTLFAGTQGHGDTNHMDNLDARISTMLELNALLTALDSEGDDRIAAIHDALSIRAERRQDNHRGALGENAMEINEGTAVYTEIRLTLNDMTDIIDWISEYIDRLIKGQSLRGVGYISGVLYGLLLDELGTDWKNGLSWDADLGVLLQEAAGIAELTPFDKLDLTPYGYAEIAAFELAWVENNARLMHEAWELFNGPVLYLPAGTLGFGRNNMLHMDFGIVYYGAITAIGAFGRLDVTEGFLHLSQSAFYFYEVLAQDIEIYGNRITGPNWVLTLNDGFELREVDGGHFSISEQ